MQLRLALYFTLIVNLITIHTKAQLESSNWHFGLTSKGLYFPPTGAPVVTNISYTPYTSEGCSVLSDPLTGALRFYTDGIRVIDANHMVMPNGSGLLGLTSSEGSGKIARDPANCNRFYIFHNTSAYEVGSATRNLYYSVVDTTLPGNGTVAFPKGDVVPGLKNILIASNVSEGMEIIPETNTHNFWLMTTRNSPSSVSVYRFTATSTTFMATYPLITTLQDIRPTVYCKANNKIAIASMYDFNNTLILDFNPATGVVTSQFVIPGLPAGTNGNYYGIYSLAWSNDGTKLYISKYRQGTTGGKLYQYNLTTSTVTLIYNVHPSSISHQGRGLKMGPNGKIYFLYTNLSGAVINVGAVTNPNGAGLACAFNPTEINMGSDLMGTHKFPDFLYSNNKLVYYNDTAITVNKPCNESADTTLFNINKPFTDIDSDIISYQVIANTLVGGSATFISPTEIQYVSSSPLPLTDTLSIMYCDQYCVSMCDTFKIIVTINTSSIGNLSLPSSISSCLGSSQLIDAGSGLFNYNWSTGDTTQTINVLTNGNYTITAQDSVGCNYFDSVTVFFNAIPTINLGNDTTVCDNLILDVASFSSITWSTGNTGQTDTINTSGLYFVNVTDINGCSTSDSINLIVHALPNVFVGSDTTLCDSTVLNLSTNQLFASTLWNNGVTTQINTINTSGLYYAIVTDTNGCNARDSINVVYNPSPVINLGSDTAICGDLILSVDSFPTITWSNGVFSQTDTISASGLYYVNVTDLNGCSTNDSINLIIHFPPNVFVGNDTVLCGNTPLTLTTDQLFPTTLWSNGITTQINTINTSGLYYATITDTSGCNAADSITVLFNPLPIVNLGNDTAICSEIILTVDSFPTINWSNGVFSQTDTISASGLYYVNVIDSNGCSANDSINLIIHAQPIVFVGNDTILCGNTPLTLTTDQLFPTTLWSNGITTQLNLINTSGLYYAIVTDTNSCNAVDSINVTYNSLPIVNLGNDTAICGDLILSVGLFPTINWSSGSILQTDTITSPGLYFVTVIDINGCFASDTINITADSLSAPNLGGPYYFCDNVAINQLLYVTGGLSTLWSTGSTNDSIIVNSADTYSVTVNSGECFASDSTEILTLTAPLSNLASEYNGCPDYFDAGSASSYLWSTTDTTQSVYIQTSGNYSVTLTGTNGCISIYSISVVIDNYNSDYLTQLPNVFTPNNDLQNDFYKLGTLFNSCTKFNSITVYNRWGQKVFESEDPNFEWDGKYNGENLPDGTYFGLIEVGELENVKTDRVFISIIR